MVQTIQYEDFQSISENPRLLPRTGKNPQPDGATSLLSSWSIDDPKPKTYRWPNTNINILVWKADITRLHVDVVVNAADENLEHDGGTFETNKTSIIGSRLR